MEEFSLSEVEHSFQTFGVVFRLLAQRIFQTELEGPDGIRYGKRDAHGVLCLKEVSHLLRFVHVTCDGISRCRQVFRIVNQTASNFDIQVKFCAVSDSVVGEEKLAVGRLF